MKIYEAKFMRASYSASIGNGFTVSGTFNYQDRKSLENLADPVNWRNPKKRIYTPNYPVELTSLPMPNNQAASFTLGINWQPGANYIELPDRKFSIGSKWPTLSAAITKGVKGIFGSDVDYTKWRFGISDEINLKLAGQFNYNISMGGFLDARQVYIPDYQHYLGNQTVLATRELAGFQLAPYYKYSNTASYQLQAHTEYHLNGLLSNKIPGFKKLNCFFVTGANLLHIHNGADYYEWLIGIENIFKVMRVDFVQGYEPGGGKPSGIRITLPIQ
jgi:hypothetical protein